jgi:hypothetical protein
MRAALRQKKVEGNTAPGKGKPRTRREVGIEG